MITSAQDILSHRLLPLAVAALIAGCATAQTTSASAPRAQAASPAASAPAAATAAAPAAAPATARPPQPGALPPFAEVTRDAKRSAGYLPLWTRDERTWLEIPADLLDKPFFLGASIAGGIGENGLWPGIMGREQVVVLKRVGNTLQLIARNQHARAPEGTPLARAVAESYSDSLLGVAPLASAPHAQSKALLVDPLLLLGGDMPGLQTHLESTYRLSYALDRANSNVERATTQATGTAITVRAHFAVPKLPSPPVASPGAPPLNPAALPRPPRVVPDARSLFVNLAYTMSPLPAQPMKARRADPRVGYFTHAYVNFGDDHEEGRRTHLIERWRLEKKDPAAAVSEPKEPIRVVMDRNIPEKWRPAVREGVLEWNRAFERAGFRNAIALEQQASDADWSSLEGARILAVRWFAQEGPGATAVGPSQSDPRTGEILRAAAIIPENWVRIYRSRFTDTEPRLPAPAPQAGEFAARFMQCTYAQDALEEAQFGFELLAARGAIDPNGPEAERFINDALKDVTMHEVGHALGLRHNFRASTGVTSAQLRDPEFTSKNGVSNSVMDYNAANIALEGERAADYHMRTLGAYDYWAIEYGYREFAPEAEKAELARLAAMSERDPALAYGPDEDLSHQDPRINQRDLGNDPLAFVQRQFKLTRELWARTQQRQLAPDDDLTIYRRNLQRGFATLSAAAPMALKYIGGSHVSRAKAGAGEAVLAPVPAAQQRAALEFVLDELFTSTSFRFDPRFLTRLGIDHLERASIAERSSGLDFNLADAVVTLQRGPLDALMSETLAVRLANAESKVADRKPLLSYAEVQQRLARTVWSELGAKPGKDEHDIDSLRRNLQREHLKRLVTGLLRPTPAVAADVRSVHRATALQLQKELQAAMVGKRWSAIARAHLDESLATLNEALKAPLVRQAA